MKSRNLCPWLKGRVFSIANANPHELHELTDKNKLERISRRMIRSLLRMLAEPIKSEEPNGRYREVRFMRTLTADSELGPLPRFAGFMYKEMINCRDGSIKMKHDPYPAIFSLVNPITYEEFSERFVSLWKLAISSVLLNVPENDWPLAHYQVEKWLRYRIYRTMNRTLRPRIINRYFSHALRLNRRAIQITRLWDTYNEDASPHGYEYICSEFDWLAAVQRDSPNLVWLASQLSGRSDLDNTIEPIAAIKKLILSRGLGPMGWRLLIRTDQYYWAYARMCSAGLDADVFLNQIITWIKRHETNRLPFLSPSGTAGLSICHLEDEDGQASKDLHLADLPDPLFVILAKESNQAHIEGRLEEWLITEWQRFSVWYADHPGFLPDRSQAKAGWKWLSRQIDSWLEAVEKGNVKSKLRWEYALEHFADKDFEAIGLTTNKALWEEGQQMCHCVGELGSYAEQGVTRYFSIRKAGDKTRLATLEIGFAANDQNWRANRCHGEQNSRPSKKILDFANHLANQYNIAARCLLSNQDIGIDGCSPDFRSRMARSNQALEIDLDEAA